MAFTGDATFVLHAPTRVEHQVAPERQRSDCTDRFRLRDTVEVCTVAFAFLVWAGPVTHGSGGRAVWVLGLGLLSLLPALAVTRPWTRVAGWQVIVAMAPASAAIVVCLTAPTGFDGLDEVATLAYAGGLFLVVRGWAADAVRRRVMLVALALVGLEQFTQAYLPWWGSGSVRTMMVGTFYWHNQFSAFMLGTGLVAGVMAVRGSGPLRTAGWLIAPWCFASLLFAGSRAGLATFVVSWLLVIALAFRDRRGRTAAVVLIGAALGLASLLTSPLLMDDSGWFTSTMQAREADQGVEGNGRARIAFWKAAVELGLDHPVTGAGFDSFGTAGSVHMPAGSGLSTYVHNGYLQAFADGGLLLLAALLVATLAPLTQGLRLAVRRQTTDEVVAVAAPISMLALVLHAGVDFDWAYPSLLALFAVLAALLPGGVAPERRAHQPLAWLVLLLIVASVPAAVRSSGLRAVTAPVPGWAVPFASMVPPRGAVDWLPAASVCRDELYSRSAALREHGLACTAHAAEDDPALELLRARVQVESGRTREGLNTADSLIAEYGQRRPMLTIRYADVLVAAGRPAAARQTLRGLQAELAVRGRTSDADAVQRSIDALPPPRAG